MAAVQPSRGGDAPAEIDELLVRYIDTEGDKLRFPRRTFDGLLFPLNGWSSNNFASNATVKNC